MFELNRIFIRKMGWSEYHEDCWRPAISIKNLNLKGEDESFNVIYMIQPVNSEKTFLITEFSDKQKAFIEYKFVIVNSNKLEIDFLDSTQVDIKSNIDLMRLIKDFEACKEEYKRHFKLNKLLR
jgi:hypothetical protein